jgi:hypothetical protein
MIGDPSTIGNDMDVEGLSAKEIFDRKKNRMAAF